MSKVSFYNINDYNDSSLERAVCTMLVSSKAFLTLSENAKVVIKPNLLAKHKPEAAVTTHPEVLRAVIRTLKSKGIKNIIVADSPGGTYTPQIMKSVYKICGLADVCESENVELYTECRFATIKNPDGVLVREWSIIEPIINADFIINLPKLKTHMMTGMSGGVKNMFGCIPGLRKAELHMRFADKERFGDMLCDLYLALKPDFTIVDGILGMEGNGPAGGTPRATCCLLGGEDAFNIDLAICSFMGMAPKNVPFLAAAMRRNMCKEEFDEDDICGEAFRKCEDFVLPSGHGRIDFGSNVPKPLRFLMPRIQAYVAPHPVINKKICIGCGKCAEICPQKTISLSSSKAVIKKADCIRCFCCHEVCPIKAIDVKQFKLFSH